MLYISWNAQHVEMAKTTASTMLQTARCRLWEANLALDTNSKVPKMDRICRRCRLISHGLFGTIVTRPKWVRYEDQHITIRIEEHHHRGNQKIEPPKQNTQHPESAIRLSDFVGIVGGQPTKPKKGLPFFPLPFFLSFLHILFNDTYPDTYLFLDLKLIFDTHVLG